jgi:outer membrane protein OmpA-like peptidoglycan-associated protein
MSITPVHRIVVVDAGLSDRGPLDLTVPGMITATPAQIVASLLDSKVLSSTTFSGLRVDLIGLGTSTAAPQTALPAAQASAVPRVYAEIVRAGGGAATIVPARRSGAPIGGALPVGVVRPADGVLTLGGTAALGDGSSIAFLPGTATFRDPAAARALLTPLAAWLAPGSRHRARVVGTTSSEGRASKSADLALSLARARAVKSVLVELGASASRITTQGKGYIADPPDRVHGALDPAKASLNRVVRITTIA